MGDFRGADAERKCAKRAVGRGVAVAADQQNARQGDAQLRADDMGDALLAAVEAEMMDAEFGRVGDQLFEDSAHRRVLDLRHRLDRGRAVVIRRGEGLFGPPQFQPQRLQLGETGARPVMAQMPVDIQQHLPIVAFQHHVPVPDFLEHRFRHGAPPFSGDNGITTRR